MSHRYTEHRDDGSTLHTVVSVRADGGLTVEVHDFGPVVERIFGRDEYESTVMWSPADTPRIVEVLGGSADETLADALARMEPERLPDVSVLVQKAGITPADRWSWP